MTFAQGGLLGRRRWTFWCSLKQALTEYDCHVSGVEIERLSWWTLLVTRNGRGLPLYPAKKELHPAVLFFFSPRWRSKPCDLFSGSTSAL